MTTFETYLQEKANLEAIMKKLAELDKKISAGVGGAEIIYQRSLLWNNLRALSFFRSRAEREEQNDQEEIDDLDGGDGGSGDGGSGDGGGE